MGEAGIVPRASSSRMDASARRGAGLAYRGGNGLQQVWKHM